MITAKMFIDKYIELVPGYPYEVVQYEDGKIKLKDIPRIYPASDFKIQKNGKGETLNDEETRKCMWMKGIRDFLECIGISMLFITAGIAAFFIFAIFYYWFYLVFEPWYDNTFVPWLMNEIKIIFSHPENFCGFFCLFLPVIIGTATLVFVVIRGIFRRVKKLVRGDKRI